MIADIASIKRIRQSLGITQKELSDQAGVSQSLIAKLEAGTIDPSFSKTKKILDTLDSIGHKNETKAFDIMYPSMISMSPDDSLKKAIAKMKKHGISQLPVIDGRQPVGMISESVILEALMSSKSPETAVREVMNDAPPVISKDAGLGIITGLLKFYPLVLVSEKGKLTGIITKSDLITKAYK